METLTQLAQQCATHRTMNGQPAHLVRIMAAGLDFIESNALALLETVVVIADQPGVHLGGHDELILGQGAGRRAGRVVLFVEIVHRPSLQSGSVCRRISCTHNGLSSSDSAITATASW